MKLPSSTNRFRVRSGIAFFRLGIIIYRLNSIKNNSAYSVSICFFFLFRLLTSSIDKHNLKVYPLIMLSLFQQFLEMNKRINLYLYVFCDKAIVSNTCIYTFFHFIGTSCPSLTGSYFIMSTRFFFSCLW